MEQPGREGHVLQGEISRLVWVILQCGPIRQPGGGVEQAVG